MKNETRVAGGGGRVAREETGATDSQPRLAGVIFDFNGVLFWDNPLHEEAWRQYSARLRGRPLDDQEMMAQVHGRVNRDIFTYVLGAPPTDEALARLAEEKEIIYRLSLIHI